MTNFYVSITNSKSLSNLKSFRILPIVFIPKIDKSIITGTCHAIQQQKWRRETNFYLFLPPEMSQKINVRISVYGPETWLQIHNFFVSKYLHFLKNSRIIIKFSLGTKLNIWHMNCEKIDICWFLMILIRFVLFGNIFIFRVSFVSFGNFRKQTNSQTNFIRQKRLCRLHFISLKMHYIEKWMRFFLLKMLRFGVPKA